MDRISPKELAPVLTGLIGRARHSVDASGFSNTDWFHPHSKISWEEIRYLADERLRLRALLTESPKLSSEQAFREAQTSRIEAYTDGSWQIRRPLHLPPHHALLIDEEIALFAHLNTPHKDNRIYLTEEGDQVALVQHHFNAAWHGDTILLHQDSVVDPDSDKRSPLVSLRNKWDNLIRYFSTDTTRLYELDPRHFEELVAELLSREEMDVELTPRSKDGGRDVLAYANSSLGRHLFYVECKRYSAENAVDVGLVRQLYGILEAERATAGLLVTTSRFTSGAIQFQQKVEHRMALKDFDRLSKWIRQHASENT